MTTRDEEIQQIHKEYTTFYQLGGGLLLVLIGIFIGALIFSDDSGYGTNIYTEILSVGLTIFVLNQLQERRDNRNRIKDLQEQLVREAGSPIHATAVSAIDTMRKRGWLGCEGDTESLLENTDLSNANLLGTDLSGANLSGVTLWSANLSSAYLRGANLSSANLWDTNLSGAHLWDANLSSTTLASANLSGADLPGANLSGTDSRQANLSSATLSRATLSNADLWGANLSGATLWRATLFSANLANANLASAILVYVNLSGADLWQANLSDALIQKSTKFDEHTILPDGTKWSEGRDLAEFGAETGEIVNISRDVQHQIETYTFVDGRKRRWKRINGWLDDRDGNPIEGKE